MTHESNEETDLQEWDKQEREAIIAGVLRGQEDFAAGRYKSLAQFIEEKRAKFGFSANWPYNTDAKDELCPQ